MNNYDSKLAEDVTRTGQSILESFIADVKAIRAELEKHLGEDQTMFSDFGAVTSIKLDGVEMLKGSGFTSVVYDEMQSNVLRLTRYHNLGTMINAEAFGLTVDSLEFPKKKLQQFDKSKAQWKQERNRYGGRK